MLLTSFEMKASCLFSTVRNYFVNRFFLDIDFLK